jgi:hypothetical protein
LAFVGGSGDTNPCRMTGYNPVLDDQSDFTRGCIPRGEGGHLCGGRHPPESGRGKRIRT